MYNIQIDSRDIEPCGIQIIQKLIENGTSLVVVKKVGDNLLFSIERSKNKMKEYEKIETIFKRDLDTKKIIEGQYRNKTIEYLKDCIWEFSEKVDGTNIRVVWDGHKVMFYGRTDKAQIPSFLLTKLQELFGGNTNEEIFEQLFGASQVVLYGEGYGAKIQNGGGYRDDVSFILFDIEINGIYLERESVRYAEN